MATLLQAKLASPTGETSHQTLGSLNECVERVLEPTELRSLGRFCFACVRPEWR
jgi:hypothetical protein